MTIEEMKVAILTETPVIFTDPVDRLPIHNQIPRAIIWRNSGKGKLIWQVELQDKCSRSVMICNPRHVRPEFGQKE